jgi:hypothetical protein
MPLSLRPTILQIVATTVYVQDVAPAAHFYDRVFGFLELLRNERVVAYDAVSATVLLLFKRGATLSDLVLPRETIPHQDRTGPARFCFAMDAEQLAHEEKHLVQKQVEIKADALGPWWDQHLLS